MRIILLCLVLASCFREAPPCDQASFDKTARSCVTDELTTEQCAERLSKQEDLCVKKVKAE